MKEFTNRGKRIMAAAAAIVVGAAAVFGIGTAVRRTTSSSVPVIPASSIDYGMWLDWENSVSGIITADAEQNIYLSDTEKVKEVLVTEGQAVHKGDVLMRYDTKSTRLNLEKEKINRERIELGIEVAKENIRTLEYLSPVSDGGEGIYFPDDFLALEAFTETLKKAEVYKKTLNKDAKPVNEDPEDETLGAEDNPYLFLCGGDSVTITTDFIARWQRIAKRAKMKQLYIALQTRDKEMNLQRSWMTDVMLLDPQYALDVDLTTGQVGFSSFNDEVRMAKLLKKILTDIPEDERAQWLAVMLDKLFIFTEREEEGRERGRFLAQMIGELAVEDREELAAAAALLDGETLSVLFKSLTPEQIENVDEEAAASLLAMLLDHMNEEQISALDGEVLTAFLRKLTAQQLTALDPQTLGAVLESLDEEHLTAVIEGLSDEKRQEIMEILQQYEEEHGQSGENSEGTGEEGGSGNTGSGESGQSGGGSGESGQGGSGDGSGESGQGGSGDEGSQSGSGGGSGDEGSQSGSGGENGGSGKEGGSGDDGSGGHDPDDNDHSGGESSSGGQKEGGDADNGNENSTEDAGGAQGGAGAAEQGAAPSTAPSPSTADGGGSSGGQLISYDAEYTSEELAQARREERQKLLDLELDLRESEIKIRQAQRAIDSGVVTAAMNGVVKSVSDPDSPPTDGSAFLTIAGADGLYLKSGIKESMLGQIFEGDIVTVTSWQNGNQYDAQIKSISPYPDSTGMFDDGSSQTYYPFTATILDSDAGFESGEWVEVTYTASGDSAGSGDTFTIMKAFVREEDNKKYVYIRGEDGTLKKQYIVTGSLTDSGYEILDGLSSSDWIAFPYGKNVKEGARTREGSLDDLYGG